MGKGLTMDLKGGRPKTGRELEEAIGEKARISESAKEALEIYKKKTPVRTGAGRAGWAVTQGKNFMEWVFSNPHGYLRIANVRSKRNAGFLEEARQEANDALLGHMRENIGGIETQDLWGNSKE